MGKGGNLIILLDIKSVRQLSILHLFFHILSFFLPQKGENTGKIRIVLPKWLGSEVAQNYNRLHAIYFLQLTLPLIIEIETKLNKRQKLPIVNVTNGTAAITLKIIISKTTIT